MRWPCSAGNKRGGFVASPKPVDFLDGDALISVAVIRHAAPMRRSGSHPKEGTMQVQERHPSTVESIPPANSPTREPGLAPSPSIHQQPTLKRRLKNLSKRGLRKMF